MNQEDLKARLQELIETSESINEIPKAEREALIKEMMAGDAEQLKEFIAALEDEQKELEEVDENVDELTEALDESISDAKILEQEAAKDKLKEDEQKEKQIANKTIQALLSQLDQAVEINDEPAKSPSNKKQGKTTKTEKIAVNNVAKEVVAGLIGFILSGFAGIFIIFMLILPMGTYERIDVAFSLSPPLFYPAYWVAIIFSAILGLIVVPFIRLLKTKSVILSVLLGGIVGGIIVGLAHMTTGLKYDIIIMQDINPTGIRGYWVAVIFSVLIGFFAQLINRVINKIELFKTAEE